MKKAEAELAKAIEESKKDTIKNVEEEKLPAKPKLIKLKVFIGEDEVFDDVARSRLVTDIL